MKKYIVVLLALASVVGYSHAISWESALGIDIITRAEWGADETWRRVSAFGISNTPTPLGVKDKSIIDHLKAYFASDLKLDEVDDYEGGEELWWPLEYKEDKKGIAIHHTVSSQETIDAQGGVIPHLQQMYKFHTFTRGWGDIGYNFLIDQDGNIYEGRAGGADVIGAHTKWNNNGTVGISLIGNFQEDYPSSKMIEALTELSTALAAYYGIDPLSDIIVHKETSVDPYVEDVHTSGIFGHRDAGTTSCPGEHVYSLLPKLRSDVATRLLSRDLSIDVDKVQAYLPVQWLWGDRTGTQTLTIDADEATLRGSVSCEWAESDIVVPLDVVDCSVDDTTLSLDVRVHDDFVAGPYPLLVNDGTHQEMWYIKTVWNTALDDLLTLRRKPLVSQLPSDPTPMQKITDHLSVDDARERAEGAIRVLLHDVSIGTTTQTISCENRCMVTVEDVSDSRASLGINAEDYGTNVSFSVVEFEGVLGVTIDGEDIYGSSVSVYDAGHGRVSLDNYGRTSYAGIPWNRFFGTIQITKDEFKNINTGTWSREYMYINELSFHDYLLGLGETAIADPLEKQKVLALLTKTYAMFYLSDNPHPSMDDTGHSVTYDAIDDPRAFQKYVGAGWLDVYPGWRTIVDEMWDVWVVYDDYIPILPYFNCSVGFTRGGQERRGWSDTPWLESVIDWTPSACTEFAGHGVGLSGKGATYMAQNGVGYADILKYYYHGITMEK